MGVRPWVLKQTPGFMVASRAGLGAVAAWCSCRKIGAVARGVTCPIVAMKAANAANLPCRQRPPGVTQTQPSLQRMVCASRRWLTGHQSSRWRARL